MLRLLATMLISGGAAHADRGTGSRPFAARFYRGEQTRNPNGLTAICQAILRVVACI